ncbi:DNAJ heat shock N-terminal domain-containing protein [Endogone sp. FLAS-F59071]|nr:DNAJ heat shock N-terminal domain-containing protein [Endogone sp. FLAS-F59071]|eukprot:RUS21141.1 DNAJ heat shock N-terminal domain-containing protein [Endogone sp. FLAS-F59071]
MHWDRQNANAKCTMRWPPTTEFSYHPDKSVATNPIYEADAAYRILEAWDVLRSPEKRKAYDSRLQATRLKQDAVVNAEVDLDDMDYDEAVHAYSTPCRCGGRYAMTEEDLEYGADTVGCDNCSLRIRVLYYVVEGNEEEEI